MVPLDELIPPLEAIADHKSTLDYQNLHIIQYLSNLSSYFERTPIQHPVSVQQNIDKTKQGKTKQSKTK